jgi:hypothetical protein
MWEERKYTLTVYSDLIEWTMNSMRQTISKQDNGTWRKSKVNCNSCSESAEATPKGTLTFTVKIPKMSDTCPDGNGNPVVDWWNQCLTDAFTDKISKRDEKLCLNCGDNEVSKDLIVIQGKSEQTAETSTLLDFNKGISVSMDSMKLATNDFDLGSATNGMTEGDKLVARAFRLDLNFKTDEEVIKPQENKNVIKVPQQVIKALNTIVKYETKETNKAIRAQRDIRNEAADAARTATWLAGAPARKAKKAKEMEAKKVLEAAQQAKRVTTLGKVNKKINIKSSSAGEQKEDTSEKSDNCKDKSTTVATFNRGFVTKTQFLEQVEIYLKDFEDDKVPAPGPYNQMKKVILTISETKMV